MIRWNVMGLALLTLVLNSGLAQAESISSISPRSSVQPGQVVTLHGQFTTENFRSRLYRIVMAKKIAPRPAGAINGAVDSFRVTPTTIMVRIPRTWHGKTVYPGDYFFYIKNMRTHRFVRTGVNAPEVRVTSGVRTPRRAAKRTILGQVKSRQQQRLGGNIGRAASPRSSLGRGNLGAGIPRGAPQMKLTLKDIRANSRSVFSGGVSLGDRVAATFDIQNLGTAPGSVRVGYLHPDGRVFGNSGTVRVLPGGRTNVLVNVGINPPPGDRNIHSVRGTGGLWWNPRFALLTTGNNPYRDSYMRDNTYYPSQSIPVTVRNDLAVVSIEGVKLTETWEGTGLSYGVVHPVSLEAIIKVKNKGAQTSSPTVMAVDITGGEPAHSAIERDRHVVRHRAIDCAGPQCLLGKAVNIAAIRAGDTVSLRVRFDRIPYHIVRAGNHGAKVALGPYICGLNSGSHGVSPGHASIKAYLQRAAANEAPPLRKDNQLILTGTFARTDSRYVCGFQNSSARRTSR